MKSLGNAVSFELMDGSAVELPEGWWITVDKKGALWRPCDIAIVPAYSHAQARKQRGTTLAPYSGHLGGEGPAFFAVPPLDANAWRKVGRVRQVLYTRPDQGDKFHPFKPSVPVVLYQASRAYKLVLPDGCKVNALGFEWP